MPRSPRRLFHPQDHGSLEDITLHPQLGVLPLQPTHIARYDFAGRLPAGITAHPKIDPATGELIVFRYDVTAPFLTWAVVGPDGTVARAETPVDGVEESYMIHDCAITARYLVVVLGPLQLDVNAMLSGGEPLVWKPELGTRVALVPRDGSPVRWVHGDPFWAWHYGNAFDDGDVVRLDFPRSSAPGLGLTGSPAAPITGSFARATLDPGKGTIDIDHLGADPLEYPRIDDRLVGRRQRFVTVAGRSDNPRIKTGEHDQMHRFDTDAGTSVRYDGHAALGEPIFVHADGGTDESRVLRRLRRRSRGDRTSLLGVDAEVPDPPIATRQFMARPCPERWPPGLVPRRGWVLGDLDSHDDPCRSMANRGGFCVTQRRYRLAPKHPVEWRRRRAPATPSRPCTEIWAARRSPSAGTRPAATWPRGRQRSPGPDLLPAPRRSGHGRAHGHPLTTRTPRATS